MSVVRELAAGVRAGDLRALAQAITLAESTRSDHQRSAAELLDVLLPFTGNSTRVGLSGPPGVGKSTLIDALGRHLTSTGHKVAVLAVDPSSARTGGSILGDKTRMTELARDPRAFIRPSPAGGTLGGVARRTREGLLLCEAAGFDVVAIETVGIGQSETVVNDMVDVFLLLVQPAAGDELQGIKRGVIELADVVVVTKSDGDLAPLATKACADYAHALQFIRRKHAAWQPRVVAVSALTGHGIPDTWAAVEGCLHALGDSNRQELRARQAKSWMWSEVQEQLLKRVRDDPTVRAILSDLEARVAEGTLSPLAAADQLMALTDASASPG